MRIEQMLERSANRYPGKAAIVCAAHRRSYAWIHTEARRLGRWLTENGLRPGERVGICLENSVDAVVWIFAVAVARATFFVVNPQARAARLDRLVEDCDAAAVVARTSDGRVEVCWRRREDTSTAAGEDDLAALVYTSGSTGEPKGVMLTHDNLCFAASAITQYLANGPDDVILSALPLAFTYGLGQVMTSVLSGATLVLERSFVYPRAVLDTMEREHVTGLPVVPTMVTLLLQQDLLRVSLPSLRYITNAAAALSTDKLERLRRAFPGARIFSMYGQTECQRATFLPPTLLDASPTSVGGAIPGTQVAVVDQHGHEVASGVTGELAVHGPHVMRGYWNRPDATAAVLRPRADGETWLQTGDLFRRDDAGLLYFVERRDAMIKTRGEKVAPRAVEEVIARLAGVSEVAVYGIPDDVLGEAVAAAITLAPGVALGPADVQRHCREYLESFMVPKVVQIHTSLPTTTSGKVSRLELRAMALEPQEVAS